MPTRVFLFAREGQQGAALQSLLSQEEGFVLVGGTDKETEVLSGVSNLRADVLLLYLDGSASAYRVAQQVYMLRPACVPIAIVQSSLMQREVQNIMKSGIRYVFEEEMPHTQLVAEIKNACTIESNRTSVLAGTPSVVVDTKVLTFFGTKSGQGKTTFLSSLAVELARQGKKVIVLDFDLQFGDVGTYFGIETRATLAELLQDQPNPTIDTIRQYISIHDTGVNILCAPTSPEFSEKIISSQIERIIVALRNYYDFVLVDTSASFDEIMLTCCEQSTDVFFVVRPEIALLKHTKRAISMLSSLGQVEKGHLIAIGVDKENRIKPNDIQRVLGLEVWLQVPFDQKTAMNAANQGVPVSLFNPKSGIAHAARYAAAYFASASGGSGTPIAAPAMMAKKTSNKIGRIGRRK